MANLSRRARWFVRALAFGLAFAGGRQTALAETENVDYSVVTTTSDSVTNDCFVSLREAIGAAIQGKLPTDASGRMTITFGDALFGRGDEATVKLDAKLPKSLLKLPKDRSLVLCGRTDARRVVISAASPTNEVSLLEVEAGAKIELRDLTVCFRARTDDDAFLRTQGDFVFTGCRFGGGAGGVCNGYAVNCRAASGTPRGTITECSFVGTRCGLLSITGGVEIAASTFAEIDAGRLGDVVRISSKAVSSVVDCTFTGCTPGAESAVLRLEAAGGGSGLVGNTVLVGNASDRLDLSLSASGVSCEKVFYGRASGGSMTDCTGNLKASEVFEGGVKDRWVGGVCRAYRPLAPLGAAAGDGRRIARQPSGVTPSVDILHRRAATQRPSPGSWASATDEDIPQDGVIVVTSASNDATDDEDGQITLQDALRCAQSRADRYFDEKSWSILFADALFADGSRDATVSLGAPAFTLKNGLSVVICGRTDVRRLKLSASSPSAGSALLTVESGASLELHDLTVDYVAKGNGDVFIKAEGDFVLAGCRFNGGGSSCNGAVVKSSSSSGGSRGVVTDCSFVGARAGVLDLAGGRNFDIATSTFSDIDASNVGSVVRIAGSGVSSVVNCTFTGCSAKSGSGVLQCASSGGGSVRVGNTIVVDSGSGKAVKSSSSSDSFDAVFCSSRDTGSAAWTGGSSSASASGTFSGATEYRWIGGVWRAFRPLKTSGGTAYGNGQRIARTSGITPGADILGRPVVDPPSPGSWATRTDADSLKRGDFVVTSVASGETDDADGVISFRDAVRYAQTRHDLRDDDGNCRISFSPDIFSYGSSLKLKSSEAQVDVTAFTGGRRLAIVGPSDGANSVTFDGIGAYRLFQVCSGNEVVFSNLTFVSGLGRPFGAAGTGAGGGVGNAGRSTFVNCAFVGCSAGDASLPGGWADGGGLATLAGGTSIVVRCSFSGCKAARGGGLATQDGGVSRVLCSTFYGNEAYGRGTVVAGLGGGVASVGNAAETILAQVTLAGNRASSSGGGFATLGASVTARMANVLAVGNTAGDSATDDLRLDFGYAMDGVWYGRGRLEGTGGFPDADNCSGRSVGETFADVRNGLTEPVSTNFVSYGVIHVMCRTASEIVGDAITVWADETLSNVGCGTDGIGSARLLCGTAEGLAAAVSVTRDEIGQTLYDLPFLGATWYSGPAASGPSDPKYGPLVVTAATREALSDAIAKAKADPSLAENGCLTVSFAPGVTEIAFDRDVAIGDDAFADVPLRICGPVTFRCADGAGCRFLTVGGNNRMTVEGVRFENGRGEEIGGAVYVLGETSFEAADCVFANNRAVASDYGSWGGAVALEEGARGVFRQCAFTGNAADEGRAIYRDGTALALYGCTGDLPGGVAYDGFHARVDKASGQKDWFDSLKTAVADCQAGDTLVILCDDIDTQAADGLPLGVTVVNETAVPNPSKAALFLSSAVSELKAKATANAAANGGAACYAVQETSGSVVCVPTAEATPTIDGAGVDLTGSAEAVTVAPANVKVGLTYGLGRADSPAGPYVVDDWQVARPDEPLVLTAPKAGTSGYYRVIVR